MPPIYTTNEGKCRIRTPPKIVVNQLFSSVGDTQPLLDFISLSTFRFAIYDARNIFRCFCVSLRLLFAAVVYDITQHVQLRP